MTAAEALAALLDAIDRETCGSKGGPFVKLDRIRGELLDARLVLEDRCESVVR